MTERLPALTMTSNRQPFLSEPSPRLRKVRVAHGGVICLCGRTTSAASSVLQAMYETEYSVGKSKN